MTAPTTSLDLLTMVVAALTVAPDTTAAGTRVYRPGDWPTQPGQFPIVKLRLIGERRASTGRGGAMSFTTVATIRLIGEVSAPATANGAGAAAAEAALWAVKRQIEVAVVNSYPLTSAIQQIAGMRAELAFNSEGATHFAGIQIDLDLEFYEDEDSFAPVPSTDVARFDVTSTHYPPHGVTIPVI